MQELGAADALLVLEPYFEAVQEIFCGRGLARCERTRLVVDPDAHDTERHFAATRSDGLTIILAPVIARLPESNLAAIIAHEFGHAADFLYPTRFQIVDQRLAEWDHPDWSNARARDQDDRAAVARMRQWDRRDDDEVERTADAIAEAMVGRPIYYNGPCVLQSFEAGIRPRPVGLR